MNNPGALPGVHGSTEVVGLGDYDSNLVCQPLSFCKFNTLSSVLSCPRTLCGQGLSQTALKVSV